MGNKSGLFFHGSCGDYDELDRHMKQWSRAIAVVDQGGDLISSRKFYQRWPGRVFLCSLTGDRTTKELVSWKTGDEHGAVTADRNRVIQFVIDHFRDKRIPVHGTENDWYEYWLDWNNLSKMKVLDPDTNQVKGYKFIRNGRDHRAMATVFWMVGMDKFSAVGGIFNPGPTRPEPNSYMLNPDGTVSFDPLKTIYGMSDEEYKQVIEDSLDALEERGWDDDWRNY